MEETCGVTTAAGTKCIKPIVYRGSSTCSSCGHSFTEDKAVIEKLNEVGKARSMGLRLTDNDGKDLGIVCPVCGTWNTYLEFCSTSG